MSEHAGSRIRARLATWRRSRWLVRFAPLLRGALTAGIAVTFVYWAHFGSGQPVFSSQVQSEPGWDAFRNVYGVDSFGHDGYFVRAIQNGYNLFHHTHEHAWRFTRKTELDHPNACRDCHSVEAIAVAFASSDRFDGELMQRVSFEERIMRCYTKHLDGFVPTIYDPAIRDIRVLARMVAHHLQLGEGSLEAAP